MAKKPFVRAFCVGQAKAGTASLSSMLALVGKAEHEPERAKTLDAIHAAANGRLCKRELDQFLMDRDQRLQLEFDVAWANQFLVKTLVRLFPSAKFIVLFRDVPTWLQSMIGHLCSREIPSDVRQFLDFWFRPDEFPHSDDDQVLAEKGVYSISAFLHAWNRHVDSMTSEIPPDRRIVIRTHELGVSSGRLHDFLGVPRIQANTDQIRVNKSTWNCRLTDLVDPDFIFRQMNSICSQNMARYFPDQKGTGAFF